MFRHTIPIGRVLGIPIDLDYSWFLIAILITWMLAVNYYPAEVKGGTSAEYWLMGAVTAVLFFASILIHELAHSVGGAALQSSRKPHHSIHLRRRISDRRRTPKRQRRIPNRGSRPAHQPRAGGAFSTFWSSR